MKSKTMAVICILFTLMIIACGSQAVAAQKKTSPSPVQLQEILLDAKDARVSTLVGVKNEDIGLTTTGKAGFLMYGPYVPLAAGSYSVKIYGTVIKEDGNTDVIVDVSEGGIIIASEKGITPKKVGTYTQLCDLKFVLKSDVKALEIRVQVSEKSNIAIRRYEIKSIKR